MGVALGRATSLVSNLSVNYTWGREMVAIFSRALTIASDPMCNIIRAWLLGPGGSEVRM